MSDSYLSISKEGKSLYKEKGSKFLGFAFACKNQEQFKLRMEDLKKEFHDARHFCSAFVIGIEEPVLAKSDDGEPNHSAGDPILGQLLGKDLKNAGVIVIRYFGGTKLGVGGLKQAYKLSAAEAIENSKIVKLYLKVELSIKFDYPNSAEVMRLISDFNCNIIEQDYDRSCRLKVSTRKSNLEELTKKLNDLAYLGISID